MAKLKDYQKENFGLELPKNSPTPTQTTQTANRNPSNPASFINPKTKDKTGYGIKTPEGDITGLTADQAFSLRNTYKAPKLTEEQQIKADYERNQKAAAYKEAQNPSKITEEQLSQLGTLTPEQQALANSNPELSRGLDIKRVGAQAIEKGVIGAVGIGTGAGIAGLAAGPFQPLVAAGGAAAGFIGGAATGTFIAIKETNADNIAGIDSAVSNAKYNLNRAVSAPQKGESYDTIKTAVGDSIAAINLAERQYKEQSKRLFDNKSKRKMEDLIRYKEQILYARGGTLDRIEVALQNPNLGTNSNYLGVDEDGNPIGE